MVSTLLCDILCSCHVQFAVRTQYKELPLLSNLICCPALPPFTPGGKAGGEVSATAETLPCTPLMLISVLPASTEASNHQDSVSLYRFTCYILSIYRFTCYM